MRAEWAQRLHRASRDALAAVVVTMLALAFYVSTASLLFQGPLLPQLPAAVGAALLGGVILSAVAAWKGTHPLAAAGPESALVPVLAAMTAAVAQACGPGPALVPTAVVTLALTALAIGGAWWAIGRQGAGQMVRHVPYPVVAGFLASLGWLMLLGGLQVSAGAGWSGASWPSPATAERLAAGLAVAAVLWWGLARLRHAAALPLLLLAAAAALHAGLLARGWSPAQARDQGWLPAAFNSAWPPWPLSPELLAQVEWAVVAQQGGLIASAVIIGTLTLLLALGGLETSFDAPGDVNHDLRQLGLANIACALAGGLTGSISVSRSMANRAAGARTRASGWFQVLLGLAALAFAGPLLQWVPLPLLGGLLAAIGLGMLKSWLWDARRSVSRAEHAAAVGMVATTAVLGFLPAVCLGVLACCVDFALACARISPVRRSLHRSEWPSRVEHGLDDSRRLAEQATGLYIVELQGALFFGSATRVLEHLEPLLGQPQPPRRVVLDLQRVSRLDSSAAQALLKLWRRLQRAHVDLQLSGPAPAVLQALQAAGLGGAEGPLLHPDIDAAVLAWDDEVLGGLPATDRRLAQALAAELGSTDDARALLDCFDPVDLAIGARLFSQGDPSDALYLLEEGRLVVQLGAQGQTFAARTLLPGSLVGEMGLYRDEARSATLVASHPCRVLRLDRNRLQVLQQRAPHLALALQRLVIRQLASRLDRTSRQMQASSTTTD